MQPLDATNRPPLSSPRALVVGCGALAREIVALQQANDWPHLEVRCIDAYLHNTPEKIPERLKSILEEAAADYERIFVAYGDCGTQGGIDRVIAAWPHVSRMGASHCFEAIVGPARYAQAMEAQPGTFWATDFLVRHFDNMVVRSLGLDKHPELRDLYFGNYKRLVFISQETHPNLEAAQAAAAFLDLEFEHMPSGYGQLEEGIRWCVE